MQKAFLIAMVLFTSCATPPRITYEGERNQEGKYHGQGVITYINGDIWEGKFKDGEPYNGQGTMTYPDGEKYVGEYKDGKKDGQGTFTFVSGAKYIGEWKGDKANGQGLSISPFGFKYEGGFKNGRYGGQGTETYPDGRKYVGEFKDGKYNGQGTETLPDGSKYVGEFKIRKRNGLGIETFSNGKKYVGEFKDSNYDGKGVLFKKNGEINSGDWTDNVYKNPLTIQAVDNFLKNKYPQFKGIDYQIPVKNVPSPKDNIISKKFEEIIEPFDYVLPPPPENPDFIAVVDFTGNNISDGICKALTNRLAIELFNTKYFKVIEREMMEQIIEEQGFQQSGCTTNECIVEVGKLIGVEKIIGGSISQVGNVFSVSARIVNVETGEIETTGVYDHMGDIGGLLTGDMKMVAYELIK